MAVGVRAHGVAVARTAAALGIVIYTVLGAIGLAIGTTVWNRMVCDDVLTPSVLGGPTSAVGATSALAAIVGIGGAVAIVDRRLTRAVEPAVVGVLEGAGIGLAAAVGPSVLIVVGSQHPGPATAFTAIALVVPSVLTGAAGVALLRPVTRSARLTVLVLAAKWVAVVLIATWMVVAFAPIERWMLLACA